MITTENLIKEIEEKKELEDAIMNNDLELEVDTFNYNIEFNIDINSIKNLVHNFFDAWFNMVECQVQKAPSGEWEEYNIDYIRYEMIYSTYKDILNDLNFNIVEEEDLVSVFYNGEQVDACEIIREEI